jgi:hypothetical protein
VDYGGEGSEEADAEKAKAKQLEVGLISVLGEG